MKSFIIDKYGQEVYPGDCVAVKTSFRERPVIDIWQVNRITDCFVWDKEGNQAKQFAKLPRICLINKLKYELKTCPLDKVTEIKNEIFRLEGI
jgi:hypothetical protein